MSNATVLCITQSKSITHVFLGSVQHIEIVTLLDHFFAPQAKDKFQPLAPKQSHQSHWQQLELSELTSTTRHYKICVSLIQVKQYYLILAKEILTTFNHVEKGSEELINKSEKGKRLKMWNRLLKICFRFLVFIHCFYFLWNGPCLKQVVRFFALTEFTLKSLFNTYPQLSFPFPIQWENSVHKQTFHTPGNGS